jgi:hypothetical protein
MALLRRYFRMSLDIGRLPSMLGREFFRARVTSYHAHSFEDVVILVHDVERCLERLDDFSRALLARVVFQDYTWDETAALIGCCRRTVARRFPSTLDLLARFFWRWDCCSRFPQPPPTRTPRLVKRPAAAKTLQLTVPQSNKVFRQVALWAGWKCYSEVRSEEKNAGAPVAPAFVFEEKPLSKRGANLKRSRRSDTQRQWAAVVQKATPKIVESLIEAAESLGERAPALPTKPANGGAVNGKCDIAGCAFARLR